MEEEQHPDLLALLQEIIEPLANTRNSLQYPGPTPETDNWLARANIAIAKATQ